MSAALTIEQLTFRYAGQTRPALAEISLSLPRQSVCAVLGATSSGKSTLFHVLAGIAGKHFPAAEATGRLTIEGRTYEGIPREVLFPTVGFAMQEPQVMISGMYETVREEIALTLHNLSLTTAEIEGRVRETLAALQLEHLADRHPRQLSGGEQQRVALATILAARPPILLLDEPRNSLDCRGVDALVQLIRQFRKTTTILFSDYQIDLALATAEYILVLDAGTQRFFGRTGEFLQRCAEFTTLLVQQDWVDWLEAAKASHSEKTQRLLMKLGYHASAR
jgi:energy-coupling factor transporter ATP-binding protein EcfA2